MRVGPFVLVDPPAGQAQVVRDVLDAIVARAAARSTS